MCIWRYVTVVLLVLIVCVSCNSEHKKMTSKETVSIEERLAAKKELADQRFLKLEIPRVSLSGKRHLPPLTRLVLSEEAVFVDDSVRLLALLPQMSQEERRVLERDILNGKVVVDSEVLLKKEKSYKDNPLVMVNLSQNMNKLWKGDSEPEGVLAFIGASVPYIQVLRVIHTVNAEVGLCLGGDNGIYVIPTISDYTYGELDGGCCCGLYSANLFGGELLWRYSKRGWLRPNRFKYLMPLAGAGDKSVGGSDSVKASAKEKVYSGSGLERLFKHKQDTKDSCERLVFVAEDNSKWGNNAKVLSDLMERGEFSWVEMGRGVK